MALKPSEQAIIQLICKLALGLPGTVIHPMEASEVTTVGGYRVTQ